MPGHDHDQLRGRCATFILNLPWDDVPTRERLQQSALHEVLELLLAKLEDLACRRYVTRMEIREASHAIIRRLEKFDV